MRFIGKCLPAWLIGDDGKDQTPQSVLDLQAAAAAANAPGGQRTASGRTSLEQRSKAFKAEVELLQRVSTLKRSSHTG